VTPFKILVLAKKKEEMNSFHTGWEGEEERQGGNCSPQLDEEEESVQR